MEITIITTTSLNTISTPNTANTISKPSNTIINNTTTPTQTSPKPQNNSYIQIKT